MIEKIRAHTGSRREIELRTSREPLAEEPADIILIRADWLAQYIRQHGTLNRLPKVIAFGSRFHMKQAFLHGCADFLKDPWDMEEFNLRLERLFSQVREERQFRWGQLQLTGQRLTCGQREINLTSREVRILRVLLSHRGEVVPREVLYLTLHNRSGENHSRAVDMHISALRKKLRAVTAAAAHTVFIKGVRGEGYRLED